ncbi:MAG: AAA family ATPase [Saprospiraceae bacterium]
MKSNIDEIPLDRIYLDPNNYRFRDHKDYRFVEDKDIANPQVQKRTNNFITGKNNSGIADLIASFKKSGFLPVDQIQVAEIRKDVYKVVEGNRRIATLKYLQEEYEKGNDLGNLGFNTFKKIPVVFYSKKNNDDLHYKVLMGLKHINGNKRWPIVNQAQLMKDMSEGGMNEQDIIDSLGISRVILRRSLKALALVQAYKASDYGDQFQADMYNIFDTIVSSVNIKYWLEWDDEDKKAKNKKNQERLFAWISTVEDVIIDESEEQYENIVHKREPIITTGRDVRELTKLINDESAIRFMEESGSIADAYLSSDLIGRDKFDTVLNALESNLNTALSLSSYAGNQHTDKFENIYKKLKGLIASQSLTGIILPKAAKPTVLFNFPSTNHFQKLDIKSYKGLSDLKIDKLNKINLFAGENNAGKTSLLEAIRLLVAQNDANNFLALQEFRGKFIERKMPSSWIVENVTNIIDIEGDFGMKNQLATLVIKPYKEEDETIDSSSYLGSFTFSGSFMGQTNDSIIRLFENNGNGYELSTKGLNHLCSFAYYSPFGNFRNADLYNAHAKSEEIKYMSKVIEFLKNSIDNDILDISLVEKNGLKRFLVNHNNFERKVDLLQFGDGLQNIFKTTLLFAIAENGIVLIDEMGTAIHHSLLIEYSKFIQQLSEEFNTQVFITSHSDECIDAFVENNYSNDSVSMYHLAYEDGVSKCKHITGERYKELNELMGIDLRD